MIAEKNEATNINTTCVFVFAEEEFKLFSEDFVCNFKNSNKWNPKAGTFMTWLKPENNYETDNKRHDIFSVGDSFYFIFNWNGSCDNPDSGNFSGFLNFATNPSREVNKYHNFIVKCDFMKDNNYHHLAISWGSGGKRIYVDGKLKAEREYQLIENEGIDFSEEQIYIGASSHFGEQLLFPANAFMKNIRLYDSQLYDKEILDVYLSQLEPKNNNINDKIKYAAVYNKDTNILYVPYFYYDGKYYELKLKLISSIEPYILELSSVREKDI